MKSILIFHLLFGLMQTSFAKAKYKPEWSGIVNGAGLLGTVSLGPSVQTDLWNHWSFTIGAYPFGETYLYQLNIEWTHFYKKLREEQSEGWIGTGGLFYLHNLDYTRGFFSVSDPYPEEGYYDANVSRAGSSLGIGYQWKKPRLIEFHLKLRMLGQGWIALYNNSLADVMYFWSPGVSVRIVFPGGGEMMPKVTPITQPSLEPAPSSL